MAIEFCDLVFSPSQTQHSGMLGKVEESYHAPSLSVKSGRTRFRVSSLPSILVFPTVAHVYVVVRTTYEQARK